MNVNIRAGVVRLVALVSLTWLGCGMEIKTEDSELAVGESSSALSAGDPAADSARNKNRGFLYITDNVSGKNSIYGFSIDRRGDLAALPGSPFATGGAGIGFNPFDAGGLVYDKSRQLIFVANMQSNDISVLKVQRDGRLKPIQGSPFPTHGVVPTSIAISGEFLYVSHQGMNTLLFEAPCVDCNVSGFRISPEGALRPIPNAVYPIDFNPVRVPLALDFNPDGDVLMAALFQARVVAQGQIGKELLTYRLNRSTGRLTPAPGSPISDLNGPIEFVFDPTNPRHVFIAGEKMETYTLAPSGKLTKEYPLSGTNNPGLQGTCWVVPSSNGKFLYATATFDDKVAVFSVDKRGRSNLVSSVPVPEDPRPRDPHPIVGTLNAPVDMAITRDDAFVYTLQTAKPALATYRVQRDGSLTPGDHPQLLLPPDIVPFGMVLID